MNILAIDTTTKFLCLGVYKQGKVFQLNEDLGTRHSELLIPKLKILLKKASLNIADIDYFASGIGPGSFTGIRIGLSTSKGFAWGLRKPLIGISSLDILARNVSLKEEILACPIIDARRSLVYSCLYRIKENKAEKLSKYLLISAEDLLKKLNPKQRVIFLGDGLNLFHDLIFQKLGKNAIFLDDKLWYPKAGNVLEITRELIQKNKFSDALTVKPLYLYSKECQIKKR